MRVSSLLYWFLMAVVSGGASSTSLAKDESVSHWSGSVDVRSKYVGGMTGSRIVDEPVIQPSITLSHENCYFNIWGSLHASGISNIRKGDEVDLSGGCSLAWGTVTHTVSLLYYDLYPLRSARGDLFALRDTMTFPLVAGFTPTLTMETDIPQDKQQLPGGSVYKMEFSQGILVGGNRVIGSITFGEHDGAYGVKREAVSFVRLGIAWPLRTGSTSVTPSLMLQHGMGRGGMAGNELLFNVNISW